VFTCY